MKVGRGCSFAWKDPSRNLKSGVAQSNEMTLTALNSAL